MSKALTIATHEFRMMVRRPAYRILTVLFPLLALLGILIYSALQSAGIGEQRPVTYGYVDMVGFVQGFQQQGKVTFQPFPDLEEGRAALLNGEIESLYVVTPDYTTTGVVQEYTTQSGLSISGSAEKALEDFLVANMLGKDTPDWVRERVESPATVGRIQLDKTGQPAPGIQTANAVFFVILGVLLTMGIFLSSGFLLAGLGEEKENRVMEVLLSSVTPGQLMVGKILGLGAAGLLQMVVWILAGRGLLAFAASRIALLAGVELPGATAFLGVIYFLLGYLFFATLMAGLGAVTTTAREGQQISAIFIIPAAIPYYASAYILSHPDGLAARFMTLFPFTAPITVMERLGANSIEPWEVAASALILLASCAVALWLVIRLFRAYLLMYGKRASLGEMWRAVRQA